jgi:hypothetical protein
VVRDDILNPPDAAPPQVIRQSVEFFAGSYFRIDPIRIDDVIAMHAPGTRHEHRRCIDVRNAQSVKIVDDLPKLSEPEVLLELEAVGGGWNVHDTGRSKFNVQSSEFPVENIEHGTWNAVAEGRDSIQVISMRRSPRSSITLPEVNGPALRYIL